MSIPLFTGFQTDYQVAEARADLRIAKAGEELTRQNIALEVRQAWLGLQEAGERIGAAELTVKQWPGFPFPREGPFSSRKWDR